ncbi:MAG: hypothetical protein CL691_03790 [Cellvibrionales bacterium]|nr:hypothetical protein [Cellvibrionales bacterium]|tara:strand:- start:1750 stop:2472 length:723 start_codon:yes stop_codon:yes gene_type:complete
MKIFLKLVTFFALFTTSLVALAEVSGQLGANTSHVRRGVELGNETAYYGAIQFDLAGLSFGATVVDTSGDGEQDYICCNIPVLQGQPGDLTETTFNVGYDITIGQLDVALGYLQRENSWLFDNAPQGFDGDVDTSEFSASINLQGIALTYIDGDVKDNPSNYEEILLGYTVGNTQISLGDVTVHTGLGDESSWKYYEISTGSQVWGLDLSATLTGIISAEEPLQDQKPSLVIGLSKSLSL